MNQKGISAIIIAKNESERIASCIDALTWTDEIIVVDSGSTDGTPEIARRKGARVITLESSDFSRIRTEGVKHAANRWLLYIDADEEMTDALRKEILNIVLSDDQLGGYVIPRKNYYLSHPWPYMDGMVRLIDTNALVRWEGVVHEHAVVRGKIGTLRSYLIHNTHRNLAEMIRKTNVWSETEARLRFRQHHPKMTWWRFFRVICTGFFDSYFRQGGWRAGTVGLIESMYQGFSMFITYAKLWEMQTEEIRDKK